MMWPSGYPPIERARQYVEQMQAWKRAHMKSLEPNMEPKMSSKLILPKTKKVVQEFKVIAVRTTAEFHIGLNKLGRKGYELVKCWHTPHVVLSTRKSKDIASWKAVMVRNRTVEMDHAEAEEAEAETEA